MVKNYITHDAVQKFLLIKESKESREYTHSKKMLGCLGQIWTFLNTILNPTVGLKEPSIFFRFLS